MKEIFYNPRIIKWSLIPRAISAELKKLSDEQIVKLVLDDEDLFLELMQRYEAKLLAYIHRLTNVSSAEAEDVLQEVFIKTYQNLNAFDSELKFSTWIYQITYNHTISHYRKNKKREIVLTDEDSQTLLKNLPDLTSLKKDTAKKLDREIIEKQINKLAAKYRDVLILKYLEDKDYNEIADIIKKPSGTVGARINRAKKQLKELLKDYDLTL